MKRANQISYGDLFSSSNFSQSPYENRLKKHPSETCLESHSQGNSQMMFSQSEVFDSQNLRSKVSTPNEMSSRRLGSDVSVNSYQKLSSNGRFQPPSKSLAPTQLGLCRAMAQEFEERESLEAVLSSLKNHSSDIKELGRSLQEKLDYSSVLTSELVTKQSENIKELLSKQFSELSRIFTTNKESSDNISVMNLVKEVGDLKATMVNQTTNLERLSKLVEDNRKLADKSLKITESLKKEIDESLCIYAKEQTDLLRCFKDKIENNLNNKLESLSSNLLEKLSCYSCAPIKRVCEKDVQTDAQAYDAPKTPSNDKGFSSSYAKNQTYSIINASGSTKRSFESTSQEYRSSGNYEEFSTSDYPVVNLSIPRVTIASPKESSYMHDSAIESRMSTPLDLSMKNLVIDDESANTNNNEKRKPTGSDKLCADDDDDLSSLVSDVPSQIGDQKNRQGGSVSLKTCTYQTTQKTVTFWGNDSKVLYGVNEGCTEQLSPAGNDRSLSFNCPKSTPLSNVKQTVDREAPECSNRGKLVLANAGCNSFDSYKRQPLAANQTAVSRETRHKKVLVRPKKQKRVAVRRSRRTKNYSYLCDPSYNFDSDFDCLEGSDKENHDPNAYESKAYTRSKKRLVTKARGEEDYSCTSSSTKSSSDSVSQLFTVLDIY